MEQSQTKITEVLTKRDLIKGLKELGVKEGMVVEVHCAMHTFGYVIGGSQTVVDALLETVGYSGTVVMTIQDGDNTEPSFWIDPPASRNLWQTIRDNMPAFKPDESQFRAMGLVAENLNRRPGAYRSNHPCCSFVAYGKYAKLITHQHELNFGLGEKSPLAALYQLPSSVLLLGVGYDNCTAMHLGEYRSNARPIELQGGAIEENGYRKWVSYLELHLNSDEFTEIGKRMEDFVEVKKGRIGKCNAKLFSLIDAVDFTAEYLKQKYVE